MNAPTIHPAAGILPWPGSGIRLKGGPGTVRESLMHPGFLPQQKHIPIHIVELKHAAIRHFHDVSGSDASFLHFSMGVLQIAGA